MEGEESAYIHIESSYKILFLSPQTSLNHPS